MLVDPVLREFARNRPAMAAAQGHVRAAKAAWAGRPDVAKVLAQCAAFGEGAALESCGALIRLLQGGAAEFVGEWLDAMLAAWREQPLAQMPFRHSQSGGLATMMLHRTGPVSLSLHLIEPAAVEPSATIAFTDCERHEVVVSGSGRAMAYTLEGDGPPRQSALTMSPGVRICGDAGRSRSIIALDAPLVLLRVAREPARPAPTRQVEISTGRVLHRASACPEEGRAELAAALLGAMGRADAAPALSAYACGEAGEGARWQALRNALALDTAVGFAALCRIADHSGDVLAGEASALRNRLCTSYPQLAELRKEPCLAN